jgi:AAA domain
MAKTKKDAAPIWKDIPRLDLSAVKPTRWLIDFFLAKGSIQLVYGSFGTRKTTAMLLAAWSVANGTPFLGRDTLKRPVLYLDYENPTDVIKRYCLDLGIEPTHPLFTVWNRSKAEPPVPGSDAKDSRLRSFIRRCRKTAGHAPWIIFDSWTSLLKSDATGNQLNDAAPIFREIRSLRDAGATCTIIDHTGHRGSRPIGTSAKMTQMDTAHAFVEKEQETSLFNLDASRTVIRVESFLKRYAPEKVGTFSFEVQSGVNEEGVWHLKSVQETKDIAEKQLEQKIEVLKRIIKAHPADGLEALVHLAKEEKIDGKKISRNLARRILREGIGRHWKVINQGHGKQILRVLKEKEGPQT